MPVDMDELKKIGKELEAKTEKKESKFFKPNYLKLQDGDNIIRVLPPPEGMSQFFLQYQVCNNIGPRKRTITPPRQYGLPDPFSDYLDSLKMKPDEASQNELKNCRAQKIYGVFVIDRNNLETGPQLWTARVRAFRELYGIFQDPDYGDVSDPKAGHDLTVNYTSQAKSSNGFAETKIRPKPHKTALGTAEEIAALTGEDLFKKFQVGKPSELDWIQAVMSGTEDDLIAQHKADVEDRKQARSNPTAPKGKMYWAAVSDADPELFDSKTIQMLVNQYGTSLQISTEENGDDWKNADQFGFSVQAAKPTPPKRPAKPPAPAKSETEALEEHYEAIKAKLAKPGVSKVTQDLKDALQ